MAGDVPDVRVRLSAEGTQEVIDAFRKVQAESDKSKQSILGLSGAMKELSGVLPTLTFAGVVTGFVAMTKAAADFGLELTHLHEKTGLSVDTLGLFSVAAKRAGVDVESLDKSLVKFQQNMGKYQQGADKMRTSVAQLFQGNADALKGLPDDQRLLKVTDALAKLGPSAQQTALAMQFFGKGGAAILPVINELGAGGIARIQDQIKALGLNFEKLAENAKALHGAMADIELLGQAAASQFLIGFAPSLIAGIQELGRELSTQGAGGFESLGEKVGQVLNFIIFAFIAIGKGAGTTAALIVEEFSFAWDQIKTGLSTLGLASAQALNKDFSGALNTLKAGNALMEATQKDHDGRMIAMLDDLGKTIDDTWDKLMHPPPAPKVQEAAKPAEFTDEQLRKAHLELLLARAQDELKIAQAVAKEANAAAKEQFDQGLIDLQTYYDKRRAILETETDAQRKVLLTQMQILTTTPLAKGETQDAREKEIEGVRTAWAILFHDTAAAESALNSQQIKDARELAKTIAQLDADVAKKKGDLDQEELTRNRQKIAEYQKALNQLTMTDAERAAKLKAYTDALNETFNFDSKMRAAEADLKDIAAARADVEFQIASGQTTQLEGQQKIVALEKERLPNLEAIAAALTEQAKLSGNQDQIDKAEALTQKVRALRVEVVNTALSWNQFKKNAEAALTSDLQNFFTSGIESAKNFADAMQQMALSVVKSLQSIAAQMLATWIVSKLTGLLGSFAGGASGGSGGVPQNVAQGGLVRGPGTGTSDSIPARLSDFEFVVKSQVVREPGMLQFLQEVNAGRTPRRGSAGGFAAGGLVATSSTTSPKADLIVGLDEGLLLKRLEANPGFARVLVKVSESNRKAMNGALGR